MDAETLHPTTKARLLMAVLEYDGTDYKGFQLQSRGRTIQGEVERALERVTQERVRVVGAGRTDAGVHARGQVVHFRTTWARELTELHRALNAVLPLDIAFLSLDEAPAGFHARFSARSRVYSYTIYNRPVRAPLERRYAYHYAVPLDHERMAEALQQTVGTHDFATFGWSALEANTERTILAARCIRQADFIRVEVEANGFLRQMMRKMVGTLIAVGTGELSVQQFRDILEARDRRLSAPAVPPCGLCLERVNY